MQRCTSSLISQDTLSPNISGSGPPAAQLKAMEIAADTTTMLAMMLSAVTELETAAECHISLNAILGTASTKTIYLKALVGNQVLLLLILAVFSQLSQPRVCRQTESVSYFQAHGAGQSS